ncbi:aminopeptidase P family protein [Georgenia yuyongxinii]|uniref:Aminopeptidase P family protein n=1 Tax=Georgenia yuyongxinii TaxID=2589797 RepID=A0A5B8C4K6_9MICO|nr:Xaa-Pro peptidase family protein [Georgenia yuyongxinii]QDC25699.1 aminopeptidase P family protein [Georgenia yuyongxinii]
MDFEEQEYRARVERAKELMAEENLDAIIVTGDATSAPNYRYLSGHSPRNYQATTSRPHLLLLTREGGAAMCVHHASVVTARQGWVEEIHTYTQPFGHTDVVELFKRVGLQRGRIGLEMGLDSRVQMPIGELERAKRELPECSWEDASPLLWKMRTRKSEAELDRLRTAHEMNGRALAHTFAEAEPGMSERDIYDLCAHALIDAGSNEPPFSQMTISSSARYRGHGTITPFSGPTEVPLEPGDSIFLDTGVVVDGYWGEFGRMAVMGEPSESQHRSHDLVRTLVRRSIDEAIRPGVTSDQAMRDILGILEEEGFSENGSGLAPYDRFPYMHAGHGLGLQSSEMPLVRLTDETVLEEGMVFSVEIYVRRPDMQWGTEESIVLTSSGPEVLSVPDRGLFVIT